MFGSDRMEFSEKCEMPTQVEHAHWEPDLRIREHLGSDSPFRDSAQCGWFDMPSGLTACENGLYSSNLYWKNIGYFLKPIDNARQFAFVLSLMHQNWPCYGPPPAPYAWPDWQAERLTGKQVRSVFHEIKTKGKELPLTVLKSDFDDNLMSGECYSKDGLWLSDFALVEFDSVVEYKYAIDHRNRIARRARVLAGPTRYAAAGASDPMLEITARERNVVVNGFPSPETPETIAARRCHQFLVAAAHLQDWRKDLESADANIRRRAFFSLLRAGEWAGEAVPEVLKAMTRPDEELISRLGDSVLKEIGPAATAELQKALHDPDKDIREKAANALCYTGAATIGDMPALGKIILPAADSRSRDADIYRLGEIGPAAIPLLQKALAHDSPQVRARAADALAAIGPPAKDALPDLRKLLADKVHWVRSSAVAAIAAIAPTANDTLSDLRKALADHDPFVRRRAAEGIGRMGSRGADAAGDLRKVLGDRSKETRIAAAEAMARIGQPPKEAVPQLRTDLNDSNWNIRHQAIEALGYFGPAAAGAVPDLRGALFLERDWPSQQAAAEALGRLGPTIAGSAADDLRTALGRNTIASTERFAVIGALASLGRPPVERLPELLSTAKGSGFRRFAIEALGHFGAAAVDAVPVLKAALEDQDLATRVAAAEALGRIGPLAKDALPTLQKGLADHDDRVRDAAAKAIEAIKRE
jgi:HEAT repeat protein